MASLPDHPNIVRVLDAGTWDPKHLYIASELCLGGSLDDYGCGEVDPAEACRLISDSCRGLDAVHGQNLLHLDLRPANILVDDKGTPKISDFGLSRWVGSAPGFSVYAPHAAPELFGRGTGTFATDQYAMAMTLAHLLAGGAVCVDPPDDIERAARAGAWPDLTLLGRNIPRALARVVKKATSYGATDRYPSIEEFKRAIDRATPAVSVGNTDQCTMTSSCGTWVIRWDLVDRSTATFTVELLKNGRRKNPLCLADATERQALKHMQKLVDRLAAGQSL